MAAARCAPLIDEPGIGLQLVHAPERNRSRPPPELVQAGDALMTTRPDHQPVRGALAARICTSPS
jgi:hypothetical protein